MYTHPLMHKTFLHINTNLWMLNLIIFLKNTLDTKQTHKSVSQHAHMHTHRRWKVCQPRPSFIKHVDDGPTHLKHRSKNGKVVSIPLLLHNSLVPATMHIPSQFFSHNMHSDI